MSASRITTLPVPPCPFYSDIFSFCPLGPFPFPFRVLNPFLLIPSRGGFYFRVISAVWEIHCTNCTIEHQGVWCVWVCSTPFCSIYWNGTHTQRAPYRCNLSASMCCFCLFSLKSTAWKSQKIRLNQGKTRKKEWKVWRTNTSNSFWVDFGFFDCKHRNGTVFWFSFSCNLGLYASENDVHLCHSGGRGKKEIAKVGLPVGDKWVFQGDGIKGTCQMSFSSFFRQSIGLCGWKRKRRTYNTKAD